MKANCENLMLVEHFLGTSKGLQTCACALSTGAILAQHVVSRIVRSIEPLKPIELGYETEGGRADGRSLAAMDSHATNKQTLCGC